MAKTKHLACVVDALCRVEFAEFVWAWSILMTRQNHIPSSSGAASTEAESGEQELALIPIWDMANHDARLVMSTYYDPATKALCTLAPESLVEGAEFRMCYGPRSNAELFVYSGFIDTANPVDRLNLPIKFSIPAQHAMSLNHHKSRVDQLKRDKLWVLNSLGMKEEMALPVHVGQMRDDLLGHEGNQMLFTYLHVMFLAPQPFYDSVFQHAFSAIRMPPFGSSLTSDVREWLLKRVDLQLKMGGHDQAESTAHAILNQNSKDKVVERQVKDTLAYIQYEKDQLSRLVSHLAQ